VDVIEFTILSLDSPTPFITNLTLIQNLLTAIAKLLQTELGGQLPSPEHIVALPIPDPTATDLPAIAIYPGNWVINQTTRDISLTEPRPQDLRQIIPLSSPAPYTLDQLPINGTVQVQLVVGDQTRSLKQGKDFSINDQQLTLESSDLFKAAQLILSYSFLSIFTVREFQQDFWIDLYDQDFAKLEQWSSLIAGILLNSHDRLVQQYNIPQESQPKTEYKTQQFITVHTLSQFHFLEGSYLSPKTGMGLQLKFTVMGQIKMIKAVADGITAIQEVKLVF
jgi:hypothetical protein